MDYKWINYQANVCLIFTLTTYVRHQAIEPQFVFQTVGRLQFFHSNNDSTVQLPYQGATADSNLIWDVILAVQFFCICKFASKLSAWRWNTLRTCVCVCVWAGELAGCWSSRCRCPGTSQCASIYRKNFFYSSRWLNFLPNHRSTLLSVTCIQSLI